MASGDWMGRCGSRENVRGFFLLEQKNVLVVLWSFRFLTKSMVIFLTAAFVLDIFTSSVSLSLCVCVERFFVLDIFTPSVSLSLCVCVF
jgi:hypothetical protein